MSMPQVAKCGNAGVALPPGLTPPPGLPAFKDTPPGLTVPAATPAADDSISVSIRGIPDQLLSEASMEVMLDQMGCGDALIRFTISRSKSSGTVSVFFSTASAAQQCVQHFDGRKWGAAGNPVHAEITNLPAAKQSKAVKEVTRSAQQTALSPAQHCKPVAARAPIKQAAAKVQKDKINPALSADAPVFEPSSFKFSADTPAFSPAFNLTEQTNQLTSLISSLSASQKVGVQSYGQSETSTELGESGSEDGN